MSTSLIPICNHNLSFQCMEETAVRVLQDLRNLDWGKDHFAKVNGRIYPERVDWNYIIQEPPDYPLSIHYTCDFSSHFPTIYEHCAEIFTIYKLRLIYENYSLEWFQEFRKDLYTMVQILGGTEVMYLADNYSNLSQFAGMVNDGVPYEKIKKALTNEFGPPVTDFEKLNFETLDYANLQEFFLDEFLDLKGEYA